MFVHTAVFWLKKRLQGDQLTDFRIALETLKRIEAAKMVFIGMPTTIASTNKAPTDMARLGKSKVDDSFDYCLTVICRVASAFQNYQSDPRHKEFMARYEDFWKRVVVVNAG